eukprot:3179734-Amphidinium_carterae.1
MCCVLRKRSRIALLLWIHTYSSRAPKDGLDRPLMIHQEFFTFHLTRKLSSPSSDAFAAMTPRAAQPSSYITWLSLAVVSVSTPRNDGWASELIESFHIRLVRASAVKAIDHSHWARVVSSTDVSQFAFTAADMACNPAAQVWMHASVTRKKANRWTRVVLEIATRPQHFLRSSGSLEWLFESKAVSLCASLVKTRSEACALFKSASKGPTLPSEKRTHPWQQTISVDVSYDARKQALGYQTVAQVNSNMCH